MMTDKLARQILIVVELFVGLTAVAGGFALLVDWIEFPIELLYGSPLSSYDIPGVVLMVVVGGSALVAAFAVQRRHPWGPELSILAGVVSIVWIAVEIAIVGPVGPVLQGLYVALGLVIILLATRIWTNEYTV